MQKYGDRCERTEYSRGIHIMKQGVGRMVVGYIYSMSSHFPEHLKGQQEASDNNAPLRSSPSSIL